MSTPHFVRRNPEDLDRQAAKIQAARDGEGDVRRGEALLLRGSRHQLFKRPIKT
jgi:hypothetical protein